MSQQLQPLKAYTKANVQLALSNIKCDQITSLRRAKAIYKVPKRTIRQRRDRKLSRRDCELNLKSLTKLEEEVIVQRTLNESLRSVPLLKAHVRDIANRLLRDRSSKSASKNQVNRFIKRTPKLRTRQSCLYNYQRAVCEDAATIRLQFTLIQNIKAKYSITDKDTQNFNESSFIIGKISSQLIIIGLEKLRKQKKLQPSNREQTTLVQGVSATRRVILPFFIFAGKVLITSQFANLPRDQIITISLTS